MKNLWKMAAGALVILGTGTGFAYWMCRLEDQWMRETLLRKTAIIAQAIDPALVRSLSGTAEDERLPAFQRLKTHLVACRQIDPSWRWIYLMGRTAERLVYFQADSETAEDPAPTPPGQEYAEASPLIHAVFDHASPAVEGPTTDRWGTWISSFVPLHDPETGQLLTVVGIDIDAQRWTEMRRRAMYAPIKTSVILLVVWIVGSILIARRGNADHCPTRFCPFLEAMLVTLAGLVITMAIVNASRQQTTRGNQRAFEEMAEAETRLPLNRAKRFADVEIAGLSAFFSASEEVTQPEFHRYTDHLAKFSDMQAWGWIDATNPHPAALRFQTASRHPSRCQSAFELPKLNLQATCMPAMAQARRARMPSVSEPIQGSTNARCEFGFVVVQPVFDLAVSNTLRGYVLAGASFDDWLLAASDQGPQRNHAAIMTDLFQLEHKRPARWLGAIAPQTNRPASTFGPWPPGTILRPLLFFDKTYLVVARPLTPDLLSETNSQTPWLLGVIGLFLTGSLASLMTYQAFRRRHLTQLVQSQTRALSSTNDRYTMLARQNRVVTWQTDTDGRYQEVSNMAETVFGFPPDALVGRRSLLDLCPPTHRTLCKESMSDLLLRGTALHELAIPVLRKSGEELWISRSAMPVRDEQGAITGFWGTDTDITARKRTEAELETSARRQRMILDNIPDAAWMKDSAGRFLAVNNAWCRLTGLRKDFVLGKRNAELLLPPEVVARFDLHDATAIAEGHLVRFEETGPGPDGADRAFETFIAPLPDVDGAEGGTIGIARDVTLHMRTEKALRESLLFRREAERIAKIGAWKANPKLNQLYWTEGVNEIIELPPDYKPDFASDLKWFDAEAVPRLRESIETALEHGTPFVLELGLRTCTGQQKWTEVRGLGRLFEGGEAFVMGTFQDITERRHNEAETQRLAMAVEQSAEAIMITDVKSSLVYVNPAFERVTGYTRDEVIGRNPRFLKGPQNDTAFYRDMWATLTQGNVWTGRFVNRRKDGTVFEEDAIISPVRDAGGRITNYVAAKHDMTRERLLEQQVQQSQKMEAIGRLAGGVAHDINNIVQAIFGFCELLMDAVPPGHRALGDVQEIKGAATRAASLTRQLLAFSRRQLISPTVLDLNQIILATQKMLERLLGEDITLVNQLSPDLARIQADAGNMEQIIMNLAVNARDAMPMGGRLSFATETLSIDPASVRQHGDARPGRFVVLSIADTGLGMKPETMHHIFEPFFTTKGPDKGTGLGLSVIYGIVQQHEGWIRVDSKEGAGTKFCVYLPAFGGTDAPTPTSVPATPSLHVTAPGQRLSILLLEDDAIVRKVITRFLEAAQIDIAVARNATEARKLFQEKQDTFDILFTDVVLPDGNGFDIAGEFKALKPSIHVILSSGYTDERARWSEAKAPGYHFIQKPYVVSELMALIAFITKGIREENAAQPS